MASGDWKKLWNHVESVAIGVLATAAVMGAYKLLELLGGLLLGKATAQFSSAVDWIVLMFLLLLFAYRQIVDSWKRWGGKPLVLA